MKKILLLIAAFAGLAAMPAKAANDDIPAGDAAGLFNEDKVWTYVAEKNNASDPMIIKMKFNGTTSLDGTEYHNYKNCYYGSCRFTADKGWTLEETSPLPAILVCEKEGKVYARIPSVYLHDSDGISFDPVTGVSEEVQLHDLFEGDLLSNAVGAGYNVDLWNLADTDGNILYKARDYEYPDPGFGLFREDRELTYHSCHFVRDLSYEVKMRFDGTTEYEGRTYHILTNTSYRCTTDGKQLEPCAPILVRADKGKVFARLPKRVYVVANDDLQYDAETGLSEEVQLYDFKCPVGETFTTLNNMGERVELKVLSEGTMTLNGVSLRKITVGYTDYSNEFPATKYDIIEDIGYFSGDTFFAFVNDCSVDGYADPTDMVGCAQYIAFYKYGNTQGETLYKRGGQNLLLDNKVWEYFGFSIENNRGVTDCRLSRYVTGTYREIGDQTYREILLDEVTTWMIPHPTYDFTESGSDVRTEKVGSPVALLREEGGKVWMRLPGESVQYTGVPYKEVWTRPVTENEETLLYDFTAVKGTVTNGWFNNVLAPAKVNSTRYLTTSDGLDPRKITLVNDQPDPSWSIENCPAVYIDVNYVEGVGNIGEGNLFELWSINPYYPKPNCICGSGEFFNNLLDRQGNILFAGRGIKAPEPEGVNALSDEGRNGDGICYDLFGRPIRKAARGQVYILNGRKYVQK